MSKTSLNIGLIGVNMNGNNNIQKYENNDKDTN